MEAFQNFVPTTNESLNKEIYLKTIERKFFIPRNFNLCRFQVSSVRDRG